MIIRQKSKNIMKLIFAGSLVFYVFSGVSSILNYAFYPIIARFVNTSQYGEIQFLVSMYTQLAVGFVVLNILAIIISVKIKSLQEQRQAIKSLNLVSSFIMLLAIIIGSIILFTNKTNLGLTDNLSILALGFSLLISVPLTIVIGQLQGLGKFITSGVVIMLAALLKLIFSTLFVLFGFGVTGAMLGIGAGMFTALIVTIIINMRATARATTISNEASAPLFSTSFQNLGFIREQAMVAICVVTTVTLLSSADSIVSRILLDSNTAGQYAAVATIAKIILAVTGPLMWLALPHAVNRDRHQILKLLIITIAVASTCGVLFSIAPELFTHKLLGINAGFYTQLVPIASLSMTLCSLGFFLTCISICLGHLRHIIIATICAIALYFITLFALLTTTSPMVASIGGQIVAMTCIITGGAIALRSRYFK
jgi:O-antigen/teichoic acid export membrane protein